MQAVVNHFLKVNDVEMKVFTKHEKEANAVFLKRSSINWKIDFGAYTELLPPGAG